VFETTELRVLAGLLNGQTLAEIGAGLSLSHPSVSKTLRSAEQKAGLRLVERHGRRLQLTFDGSRVAVAAQETLATLREIDGLLSSIRTGESGALRIIARNSVCNYLLAPVLGGLLRDAQGGAALEVDILGIDNDVEIWARFDAGEFEIAIDRTIPPPHVAATHLFDDQLCLCVATDSPLARAPIDWGSLADHTLIGPLGAEQLWGQFSLLGIKPRSRIRVSSVELAKRLVEDGHAVALLYRSVAMAESVAGRIVMLELPDAPLTVSYWMATRTSASPLVQRFAQLIRDQSLVGTPPGT
jgi:DNA-binding transcriptional LysR family regulator